MAILVLFLLILCPGFGAGDGNPLRDREVGRVLITRLSAAYKSMQPSLLMRGEIARRKLWGGTWQATKREYRLVQAEGGIRADVCDITRDRGCVVYVRRGGEVLAYLPQSRRFAILASTDPIGRNIQDALSEIRMALYGRLVELASGNYAVTSVREEELTIRGLKRRCYHIKFRPSDGEEKTWSAEVWIEVDLAVAWRSRIVRQEEGEIIEEDFALLEIKSGADVPVAELAWKPPADAKPMERYPSGPLPR